jgi:hypothetical protein
MKIDLPLDGNARQAVRPVSRALFGGEFVLEALVLMAQEQRIYGGQMAAATGCEGSYASGLLRRLADAGLIELVATEPGQVRKYYRTRPSPLWDSMVILTESLIPPASDRVARLPNSA